MNLLIIQARMGSTRLPGKVLLKVDGQPLLKFMVDRVNKSERVDKIIIATTTESKDDPIVDFCKDNNWSFYRGSENDVLDRYYQAAKLYHADTIIRLTADCPLIDAEFIDKTIELYLNSNVDYASNTCPPDLKKYPDGSDVEVFSFTALEKAWNETTNLKDREHVTFYFWKRGKDFSTALLDNKENWGNYRITVDYPEDFIVVERIIKHLKSKNKKGSLTEIIEVLKENPEISELNSNYTVGANW
jgi:spore coat polysaccharide biosynthesis protein SpsF